MRSATFQLDRIFTEGQFFGEHTKFLDRSRDYLPAQLGERQAAPPPPPPQQQQQQLTVHGGPNGGIFRQHAETS